MAEIKVREMPNRVIRFTSSEKVFNELVRILKWNPVASLIRKHNLNNNNVFRTIAGRRQ